MAGHLAKAGVEAGEMLREFRVTADELAKFKPGDVVGVGHVRGRASSST